MVTTYPLRDEVFDPNFRGGLRNFRFPFISKGVSNGKELLLDRVENQSFAGEEGLQPIDQLDGVLILFHNFALFKVGKPWSLISKIAWACTSEKANFSIKRSFASFGVLEALMVAMMASMWSIAFLRPSRI